MNKIVSANVALVVVLVAIASSRCSGEQVAADANASPSQQEEESYQRVYEAFSKLMQNMSNNSLTNARRLVSRLNKLVGQPTATEPKQQPNIDEKTDQILNRLDRVDRNTDQHTLSQLNEDVNKLVSTLNSAYLRNIRRVIERVDKVVGASSSRPDVVMSLQHQQPLNRQFQSGDHVDDPMLKQPGFPGFDEFIVAMDRVQKSLAHFVRSSTRLITSG